MNLKDFHNNGSDIFEIIDHETEKFICKVKVNRKKNFDLIQIEDDVYSINSVSTISENIFGVKKINFNFNPKALYHYNNVFHCSYCGHKYIRDDDFTLCYICKGRSKIEKVIINIQFPFIDTFEYELNEVRRLCSKRNRLYIHNKMTPYRRGRIMKCENIIKKHVPLKNQITMKDMLKRSVLDEYS